MKQSPIGVEEVVDQNGGPDKARRRALLARLGKGSAALAAMGPLASHAGNSSHKCANTNLPGGWGCATFSGYQSAVVSTSSPTVGQACHPSYYCKRTDLGTSYQSWCGSTTALELAKKISSTFSCSVTDSDVTNTLYRPSYKGGPTKLVVAGKNLVICPLSATAGFALQGQNLSGSDSLVNFNSIFTSSGDQRTLLEVMYEATQSSTPAHARGYFASTYLTVCRSLPAGTALPTGFNTDYVKSSYPGDTQVDSNSDPYKFLKALCVIKT